MADLVLNKQTSIPPEEVITRTVITNATKSFYTVSKVQAGNAGSYAVIVDNGLSSAVSSNAVLTVSP